MGSVKFLSIILYVFGLDTATGTLNYTCDETASTTNCGTNITIDALGNIIIYDPEYNSSVNPVYYNSPNIIVPNPTANDNQVTKNNYEIIPRGSSSPAYQS